MQELVALCVTTTSLLDRNENGLVGDGFEKSCFRLALGLWLHGSWGRGGEDKDKDKDKDEDKGIDKGIDNGKTNPNPNPYTLQHII